MKQRQQHREQRTQNTEYNTDHTEAHRDSSTHAYKVTALQSVIMQERGFHSLLVLGS